MANGARIEHFNVAIHLDNITLLENAKIGRNNWITGMSTQNKNHFTHQEDRIASLIVGKESAITKNHHIDCTNLVSIGDFSIIGGYQSQFLTHSIDFINNRQHSNPIIIGNYCFVGTRSILMGGAVLPDNSILGANSLLNKSFVKPYTLYAGSPAAEVKPIPMDAKYFL
jgi:acetyltransferase-like isoleucine patch superfamily enzyme